jgi:hypothetical protein
MDMIDKDERLLQQFFSEAANQKIADDGFTERVMQRIEAESKLQTSAIRLQTLTRLWTWFCIAVFAILFVVFHGWELLAVQFEVMLRTMATQSFSINLLMLFSVVFGLLFVGTGEIISSELARK